jgi:hypothetical protein
MRKNVLLILAGIGAIASIGLPWLAHAQDIPPTGLGTDVCLHSALAVPGLSGLPTWPPTDNTAPAAGQRAELSDPRWGNGPLLGLKYPNDTDNVRYRFTVNGDDVAVTIQAKADAAPGGTSGATTADYLVFGITDINGDQAYGVRIVPQKQITVNGTPTSAVGRHLVLTDSRVRQLRYDSGAVAPNPQWTDNPGIPSWITSGTLAVWNDPSQQRVNGTAWGVSFKFKLSQVGLSATSGTMARYFVGAHIDNGSEAVNYASADVIGNCSPVATCATFPTQADTGGNVALPAVPEQWTNVTSLVGACAGVRLRSNNITSDLDGDNAVNVHPSEFNAWTVSPTWPGAITAGQVRARVRLSNWGTVARSLTDWNDVVDPLGPALTNDGSGAFKYGCQNGATGLNICDMVDPANITPTEHQCMLVELSSANSSDPVEFEQASAYRNMYYQGLSEVQETATISVEGLDALLGNDLDRDIYLYVEPRNMPDASANLMTVNVPALQALRAQAEPGFASTLSCDSEYWDACVNNVCAYRCYEGCYRGDVSFQVNGVCWCKPGDPDDADECGSIAGVNPAGGGINPATSSLTAEQKLRAEYPNIEIFPFYDTGKRYMEDGVEKKVLVPMPTFGMFVHHTGGFYGYLHELTSSDATLTRIRNNYYKLTIPRNRDVATLQVSVSAEEQPHFAPFTQIAGSSTLLGFGLGNAFITGTASNTTTVDLSKATMRIDRLLTQGNTELITNLGGPVTMTRLPGATPTSATFRHLAGARLITVTMVHLPLIGQITQINVTGASVNRPPSCGLLFGTAMLKTSFTINDGTNRVDVSGEDQWSCFPGQMVNY